MTGNDKKNDKTMTVEEAASHGRHNDDMLIHVSRSELPGLAALSPTGELTINPETGLPEAFGLSSILGVLGSIAGVAAAPFTGGMSLALTGAIGGGLGTFGGALLEGKDIGTALTGGIMSGLLGYGAGSALGSLAEFGGSEAAKEGAQQLAANGVAATPMTTGAAMSPVGTAADFGWGASGLPAEAAGSTPISLTQPGTDAISQQAINQFGSPSLSAGATSAAPWEAPMQRLGNAARGATDPSALWSTFGKKAMDTTVPIGLGLYGQSIMDQPQYQPPGQPQRNIRPVPKPTQRGYVERPDDYPINTGQEWNYYPSYTGGGYSGGYAEGGKIPKKTAAPVTRKSMEQQLDDFGKRMNDTAPAYRGIESADPFIRDMPREQRFDNGGMVAGLQHMMTGGRENIDEYGYARGGPVSGPGGGIADLIPARIDGQHPAALSSGEFVVPAHAVSALGDGSTEEGSRQLDHMVSKVMKHKYGTQNRKPKPMGNPQRFMPGGSQGGGNPFV